MAEFADTSQSQLALVKETAQTVAGVTATAMQIIPITSESLKTSQTGLTDDSVTAGRQFTDSKVVGGSSGGGINVNMKWAAYDDLLASLFMGAWADDASDIINTTEYLFNGSTKQPYLIEKRLKAVHDDQKEYNHFVRMYEQQFSSGTIEIKPKGFVTLAMNFMGQRVDTAEVDSSVTSDAGKIASVVSYTAPPATGLLDGSNSISGVTLRDSLSADMAAVFQSLTINIDNQLREDDAVGQVFAAGISAGRFKVTVDADIYFKSLKVLEEFNADSHMELSVIIDGPTGDTMELILNKIKILEEDTNISGADATLVQKVKFQAFPFDITVDSVVYNTTMGIKRNITV